MLQFITDFADQAVVLPVAGTFALSLAAQRWWRASMGWALATAVVLTVMLALKIAFAACGGFDALEGLRNPSGHTAVAGLVAGGLARLLSRERQPSLILPSLAGLLAAVAIGITRVGLGDHSVGDVIAATPIGVAGAVLAAQLMGPPPLGLRRLPVLIPAVLVAVAIHGAHLRVEDSIQSLAFGLSFCR